ncbi:hypothetical protein N9N67_07135, partial [Bacteriovoracaceae bacterium]|nr:hypothetical protein [Bacteriovoracaceae bacterium]
MIFRLLIIFIFLLCSAQADPDPIDPTWTLFERIVYQNCNGRSLQDCVHDADEFLKALNEGYRVPTTYQSQNGLIHLNRAFADSSDYFRYDQGRNFFYQNSVEQMNELAKEKNLSMEGLKILFQGELERFYKSSGATNSVGTTPEMIAASKVKTIWLSRYRTEERLNEVLSDPSQRRLYNKDITEMMKLPYNYGAPNPSLDDLKDLIKAEINQLLEDHFAKYEQIDPKFRRVNIDFNKKDQLYFAQDNLNSDYIQHALGLEAEDVSLARKNFKQYIQSESVLRIIQHLQSARESLDKLETKDEILQAGNFFFESYERGIRNFESLAFGINAGPLGIPTHGGDDFTFFYALSKDFEWFRKKRAHGKKSIVADTILTKPNNFWDRYPRSSKKEVPPKNRTTNDGRGMVGHRINTELDDSRKL